MLKVKTKKTTARAITTDERERPKHITDPDNVPTPDAPRPTPNQVALAAQGQKPPAEHTPRIVPDDVPAPIPAPTPHERPVSQLNLQRGTLTALEKAGIEYIGQLQEYDNPKDIPGVGDKKAEEITEALAAFEVAPDQIPLAFNGLIVVGSGVVPVVPEGWKLINLEDAYGPCDSVLEFTERLRALTHYHKLIVRTSANLGTDEFIHFIAYNRIPVFL